MTKSILALSAADIHGNVTQYEKIKKLVTEHGIDLVCLCGDLLPKDGGSWTPDNKIRTIAMQADFMTNFFLHYLKDLGTLTTVCAVFGNDDFKDNYHLLADADLPNVHFLNNETVTLNLRGTNVTVAGYPYVGVTPFLHKDWEKWDDESRSIPHKVYRTDGYTSKDGTHPAVDMSSPDFSESTIEEDLIRLAAMSDPQQTVYIFHEAPYDTPLDVIAPDNPYIQDGEVHIGSKAIRRFIEKNQPLVTMHGHIHETFDESGDYVWKSGHSVSFTAANDFKSDTLSYVLFSLPEPRMVERKVA